MNVLELQQRYIRYYKTAVNTDYTRTIKTSQFAVTDKTAINVFKTTLNAHKCGIVFP